MITQKTHALVLGNGPSSLDWDPSLVPDHVWIIGTNRWFERTRVDAVVAADEYQVRHALNTLDSEIPLWTKEPWATKWRVRRIPLTGPNDISGALGIRLASHLGFDRISTVGFDSLYTKTRAAAYPNPAQHPRMSAPPHWYDSMMSAVNDSPSEIAIYADPTKITFN